MPPPDDSAVPEHSSPPAAVVDWPAWRARFPDLGRATYLDTSSHGAKSTDVVAALRRYADGWTIDAPWETEWRRVVRGAEAAFGRAIGAGSGDVTTVPSLTDGLHRAMSALARDGSRPRVVLSAREWVSLRHAVAAWPDIEPVLVDARVDPDDAAFLDAVDERTRLVIVSHVCFRSGVRADLAPIAARARAVGASVFVDAFQSAGVAPLDVGDLDVDFVCAGALKYLLGVPGIAYLYVHPTLSSRRAPFLAGWRGQGDPMDPTLDPAPGALRFAGGTWPVPNAYAAAAGLALIEAVGVGAIAVRVEGLLDVFMAELGAGGIEARTPRDPARRAGICVVPWPDAAAAVDALRAQGILASARPEGIRFSFHAYNTEAEARAAARLLVGFSENGNLHA